MNVFALTGLTTLALAGGLHAAAYSTNFNSFGAVGSDLAGQDGWTINDTGDQFSLVASWNSSKSLGLGDASAVTTLPAANPVALSHGYSETVGSTTVNFNFALFDSSSDNPAFTNRDEFGISLTSGPTNLLTILFVPLAQSADPANGADAQWNLFYRTGAGPAVPLNLAVLEGAGYFFDLDFSPNANPLLTDFSLSITGANTLTDGATGLALNPTASTTDFNVLWGKHNAADYGSNIFLMDNLAVVPEPSAVLLLSIAGLGLVSRRRRA